jgi:hypothetical protein
VLVEEIPSDYLRWILAAGFFDAPDVRYTAERELARRELEPPASVAGKAAASP